MMYGFGDDQNPYSESVDMLEDLVVEFITEMVMMLLLVFSTAIEIVRSSFLANVSALINSLMISPSFYFLWE